MMTGFPIFPTMTQLGEPPARQDFRYLDLGCRGVMAEVGNESSTCESQASKIRNGGGINKNEHYLFNITEHSLTSIIKKLLE